jgi:hypothetical protein
MRRRYDDRYLRDIRRRSICFSSSRLYVLYTSGEDSTSNNGVEHRDPSNDSSVHLSIDLELLQDQLANMTWEDIGKKARARLDESIPSEWRVPKDKMPPADQASALDTPASSGLFSEDELSITTSSATHIVQKIASGEWTAVDVTRAFCKRAAVAHQLVRSSRSF